jgi:hypothetical protein
VSDDPTRTLDVFLHIPKAAGTTLSRILRTNLGPSAWRTANVFKGEGGLDPEPAYERMIEQIAEVPDARLVTGHVPLGIDEHMPADWKVRYFTCLREPVERAISHYYEIVESERHGPRYAKDEDAVPLPTVDGVPYDEALSHPDFVLDNLQTRMLSGDPRPFGPADEGMLERALDNLRRRIRVIGLAERFDESLVVLDRRLGHRAIAMEPKRVNETRPRGDAVPLELRRAAERANQLDARLYERATELFDSYEELGTLDVLVDVMVLRHLRTRATDEPGPPPGFDGSQATWTLLFASRVEALDARSERMRTRSRNADLRAEVATLTDALAETREELQLANERLGTTLEKLARSRARNKGLGLKAPKEDR